MGFAALYPSYEIIPLNGKRCEIRFSPCLAAPETMRHDRAEHESRKQCGS